MTNAAAFLFILGVLVAFHEFGHLVVAKACGMKVDAYSIGFGPKLFSFKMGETEYCVSLIPLGGYVKPAGPNYREDVDPNDPDKNRYFISKPAWKRALMISAGPLFNLLLAFLMVAGVVYYRGSVMITSNKIGIVAENSPASRVGLREGDVIVAVNDEKISEWMDIMIPIQESGGGEIKFTVKRDDTVLDIKVVPEMKEQRLIVGIGPVVEEKKINGLGSAQEGASVVYSGIKLQAVGVCHMLTRKLSSKNLGGPVMIYQETGKAAKAGLPALFGLMVMLSIALGFFNLLPIPILDGGHLFIIAVEAVIGPISKGVQSMVQMVGLGLLMFILIFATSNDLSRLFKK